MPDMTDHFSSMRAGQQLDLGKSVGDFIDAALPDFTHLTVLMFLVRQAKAPCTVGDIAGETGDPKRTIQAVVDRFEKMGVVRTSSGFLSKKYALDRDGPRMDMVGRLVKLWEHPQSHEVVLRRVLTPK
jgi:hypothetical protein